MRFLILESEEVEQREARREHTGCSSGESYQVTLEQLCPGAAIERIAPGDPGSPSLTADELAKFDAVFVAGSPMHVYEDRPEVRRQLDLMRAVFASGTPSFGSCAGLQLAVAAAGGTVRKMPDQFEAAIARRITRTPAGDDHPLLAGRAAAWDAPAVHRDEVETLPPGGICLASNAMTRVQAAEIRHDRGVFWGVQYHPELAPGEIAAALRRQADDLVAGGLGDSVDDVEQRAVLLDRLQEAPGSRAARWALGIDGEFADEDARRRELANFIAAIPDLKASGTDADVSSITP